MQPPSYVQLRTRCLQYFLYALYGVLLFRLFQLQVDQKYFLAEKAHKQQHDFHTIKPTRGLIYDRFQKPLLLNQSAWDVALIPIQKSISEQSKKKIINTYPKVAKKMIKREWNRFCWLERQVDEEQKQFLLDQFPEAFAFQVTTRYFPYKHVESLLGFTSLDGKGLAGLELTFDQVLAGEPGERRFLRSGKKNKRMVAEEIIKPVVEGFSLQTTLDDRLQRIVYNVLTKKANELNAKGAGGIILDPKSGEVLALVSYTPTSTESTDEQVLCHQGKNLVVEDAYELGSVIKALLALAALDEGIVTPETEIDCQGRQATIGGMLVKYPANMGPEMHVVPFATVIQKSNNIGVAKVGFELQERLYHQYKKMGCGQKTGIQLPAEQAGCLRPFDQWTTSSPVALSFGYEVSMTLIQLARFFCMVANDGLAVPITLVPRSEITSEQLYSREVIAMLKPILERIGTRYSFNDFTIYGKTGTARLIKDGQYSNKHHLYTFAGVVEKGEYKRVVVTMIKEPEAVSHLFAAQITAPVFKEIAQQMVVIESAV